MTEIPIPDPPRVGSHVAIVRVWWKRRRRHHYRAIRWIEFAAGPWRPSPRAQTWAELAAEAVGRRRS